MFCLKKKKQKKIKLSPEMNENLRCLHQLVWTFELVSHRMPSGLFKKGNCNPIAYSAETSALVCFFLFEDEAQLNPKIISWFPIPLF